MDFVRIWQLNALSSIATDLKNLGLLVRVLNESMPAIEASDNSEFDYYVKDPRHTGFFATLNETSFHVNTIVIAAKDRGKGLAKKIIDAVMKTKPKRIEFSDESGGFWKKMESLYPDVEFCYE